ncbi:M12 family metallopeptidase, partial [Spirosoma migulaei]
DFGSVMLYGSYDFSKNGLPTMTKKDGSTFIGQRQGLSATDIKTIGYMYP